MSDANYDFRGSCGKCKEVKCGAFDFKDGYGTTLERRNNCYNTEASVVVQITDTCPCVYGGNYYSNKRWCCGDMYHSEFVFLFVVPTSLCSLCARLPFFPSTRTRR